MAKKAEEVIPFFEIKNEDRSIVISLWVSLLDKAMNGKEIDPNELYSFMSKLKPLGRHMNQKLSDLVITISQSIINKFDNNKEYTFSIKSPKTGRTVDLQEMIYSTVIDSIGVNDINPLDGEVEKKAAIMTFYENAVKFYQLHGLDIPKRYKLTVISVYFAYQMGCFHNLIDEKTSFEYMWNKGKHYTKDL
ncbi:MAG: hypothetical protein POELPBGB_01245 [Bacteroidia bacterium]|nr:hypothetical protein [Bacteroidia bacterium]